MLTAVAFEAAGLHWCADVTYEAGGYWAHVSELPGCFASGADLDELRDALVEAVGMVVAA